ncbi:ABC transporter ATP-binding protein [Buchananella felis]|uniref:ABC transporter ATP-binding protein n=1 Tax=Buchananella felis TaxID=3231492 RepID=UPI0035293261
MLMKLLARYSRPYSWRIVLVVVLQAVAVAAMLYVPTLNADIIDKGVATGDTDFIWRTGGYMLLVSLGQIVASILATLLGAYVAMAVGRDLRADMYGKISSFSSREIAKFGPGSLITRSTNDVLQVQTLLMMGSTMLLIAPLMAIGGVVLALRQDAKLSWLLAISVPLLLGIMGLIVARMVPAFRTFQDKQDAINRVMREQLTGIRVIRAFAREKVEQERFDTANRELTYYGELIGRLFVVMFPLVMLILNVTIVGVIWFGGIEIDRGTTQIGTLFAFMSYVMQILMGVVMASFLGVLAPRAAVSSQRIGEVLETNSTLVAPAAPATEHPRPGEVEFDDVTFGYPGAEAPVLHGLSFTAAPGSTLAIVGATGSGKTTLVSLIPRLVDVTSGAVRVGGVDVRDTAAADLVGRVSLIPQRPYLFAGTIASNLRLGRPQATDEELWHALEIAQARDFVAAKEGGLEAKIAQGGTNVSGGQRQRLSIARAIVHQPDVFVFDDSFSALDLNTDARLRAALWEALPHTTKIVVAQRVSTITQADKIVVLDEGRVVGEGTHDELLATSEVYREIVASQLGAEVER